MTQYAHVLIASDPKFVPQPAQVVAFLLALERLGAAPLAPEIRVAVPDKPRMVPNPFVPGELVPMRASKSNKVDSVAALAKQVSDLPDYTVLISGEGPAKVQPIAFDVEFLTQFKMDLPDQYAYELRLKVRPVVHSTSDPHDDCGPVTAEFFGKQCTPGQDLGIYHHPSTLEIIRVPGAGCARFWIEFEFGKLLFPKIDQTLDLINPSILKAAKETFALKFLQGCRWCA